MSIGLYNFDSSYFKIDTPAIDKVSEKDIINFSITEEMGKINNGSLLMYDPNDVYSRMLRVGAPLVLEWGYNKPDLSIISLFGKKENPLEMIGGYSRKNFRATSQSPSGGGSSDGVKTFNMGFYGAEYYQNGDPKVHKVGTKGTVIKQIFTDMGVFDTEINFTRMNEQITPDTYVFQYESNFKFLNRMAYEWGAVFRIGYNKLGKMAGTFISEKLLESSMFPIMSTSAISGSCILLSYKDKPNNVVEFTWQNHAGDSGSGDNIRINIINGQTVFQRFVTKTDSVEVWTLDMNKLRSEMQKRQNEGGITDVTMFVKKWMATNDWEQIKTFFIRSTETTAPQGLGYTVNVKMLGNPLMTAPSKVVFGKGFPDCFSNKLVSFFVKKVTHKIDRQGYFMDLECADVYTALGGSML